MLATKMRVRQIKEIEVAGLGDRIRQARIAISNVKSLEQICNETDLSRTYWYDLEKETLKGALSVENLRKIEAALGVSFDVEI